VGIDLSERLLALAQQEEDAHPLHIVYQLDDAQKGQTLADASFDGVACNMALMDIPDLTATFRTVWRILRSHGWFAFSITPPCLQMPGSFWVEHHDGIVTRETGNYFAEGFWVQANATGVKGRVGAHHRIVSTYLNTLVQAGFQIRALAEPRAEGVLAEQFPAYRELPAALVVYSMKI
jgi:SAM-dependent methyltransferase